MEAQEATVIVEADGTTLKERPFKDQKDLQSMVNLLKDIRANAGDEKAYLHIGDVEWRFFRQKQSSGEDPQKTILLLQDENDAVTGFAWVNKSTMDVVLNPQLPRNVAKKALERVVEWGEATSRDVSHQNELSCISFENDELLNEVLSERGYNKEYTDTVLMTKLDENEGLSNVRVADGYMVKGTTTEEVDKLTQLRQAGTKRDLSIEKYRDLLAMPDYRQDLHIVAVAPNGDFAAHALGWIDTQNGVGLFEPVATHPDHRKLGLGKAVMYESMRRMKELGADRVLVTPDSSNAAAVALYTSVGFKDHARFSGWKKSL